MKKTLQMKGVPAEQAEAIAKQLSDNPEIASSLKSLEQDPEIKGLLEKIQKEVEQKKKEGMADVYAMATVMEKYKSDITKHREALEPLMRLMMKQ